MPDDTSAADRLTTGDLVKRAEQLIVPGQRRLLGITGPPGSGKSTLAGRLVERLGPERAALVGMDGFHLSNAVLRAHGSLSRKGAIDTFDDAGFAALLARLAVQRPGDSAVFAPEFNRSLEESLCAALEIGSAVPLVITEGNYLLAARGAWIQARASLHEVWFLATDPDLRHRRLIARHEHFGRKPDEARAFALGSDEVNAQLIEQARHRADLVVAWADYES